MRSLLKIPRRLRKFIGIFLLVPFVLFYALLTMALAVRLLAGAAIGVQALYYGIAGLAFVLPAACIIWFMQKPGPSS